MSLRHVVSLVCDRCGVVAFKAGTGGEVRIDAKSKSWHVNLPDGRDICADCWDSGIRVSPIGEITDGPT